MDPNNPIESSGNQSGISVKRKRGRPRKDSSLKHSGRAQMPPNFEAAQQQQQQQKQHSSQTTPAAPDPLLGQAVNGVIEASFDGGYLLSVKIENSDSTLRGLLFKPGKYVPVTTENDIAPHLPMIRRESGFFAPEPQSSSRGQKLAVQRAGTKGKHNGAQPNPVPVIHEPGNFQSGLGILDGDDRDVHVVEPITMLPPDRTVPVAQLFSPVRARSSPQVENGSLNDGQLQESKSNAVILSSIVDTPEAPRTSDVNIENGKQASKSSEDFGKQEIGAFDVPFTKEWGFSSYQETTGNADDAPREEARNVSLTMNFSENQSQTAHVATPFLNFGTRRMTELLQAVQENVNDAATFHQQAPSVLSNLELHGTMSSETDGRRNAGDP